MTTLLENQRAVVALEAFTIQDTGNLLHRVFPAIQSGFRDLYNLVSPNDKPTAPITSQQKEFLEAIAGRNYVSISPLPARVPEGLKVPYLVYGEALSQAVENATKIVDQLSLYTLFLGQLVTNHDHQFSSEFNASYYKKLQATRDMDNQQLGACFQPGSTKADRTFGDVVARNADWKSVFNVTNAVSEQIDSVNRRTLSKKIEEAGQLLDVIEKKLERNELEGVSPQVVTELSEGAYHIASQLEMYSSVYYKVQAFVTAVNKSMGVALRAFGK